MVQSLDHLAWYAAFTWSWHCKTTSPKKYLQWWLSTGLIKHRGLAEALIMQVMTGRQRWWLPDEKLWVLPLTFSTEAKTSTSLPKMCHLTFTSTKILECYLTLPTRCNNFLNILYILYTYFLYLYNI